MRRRQWIVYGLIALAWVALWTSSRQWISLVPLGVVFLLHPVLKGRVSFTPSVLIYAILALAVAGLRQVNPVEGLGGNTLNAPLSFYVALGALGFAALKLYSPPDRVRTPRILLFTALAVAFSGAGLPPYLDTVPTWEQTSLLGPLTPGPHEFFAGLTAVYGIVCVMALRAATRERREAPRPSTSRRVVFALSVACAAALSVGGAWVEKTHYEDVSRVWQRLAAGGGGGGGGFSDQANLDSVSNTRAGDAREVALRIFSPREPGYLRGKAFVDYVGKGWSVTWPDGSGTEVSGRYPFPEGREVPSDEEPLLTVHPASDYEEQFFLPLEACAVETACDLVELHAPGNTLRSKSQPTTRGYGVFVSDLPLRSEANLEAYVAMPKMKKGSGSLVAALDTVLARIEFPPDADPALIKDVIAGHFRMHYRYEVGLRFKPSSDPLTQFLTQGDAGHCELFASAGALLLRRKGIPARYVTGFVCQERGLGGSQWIARNAYAHAWVEFYTPQAGWQVAEFTPAGGVPQPVEADGGQALLDWLGGAWEQLAAFVMGLPGAIARGIRGAFAWLSAAWWRMALAALMVGGFLAWRFRSGPEEPTVGRPARAFTGELAAKRARYLELEGQLSKAGLGRQGWETVLEYAARLEGERLPEGVPVAETVAFLRAFASLRYAVQ